MDKALEIGGNIIRGIVDTLTSGAKAVWDAGWTIINKIREGGENAWKGFSDWLGSVVNSIPGFIKDVLGIHSLSSVMASIGENLIRGLEEGIKRRTGGVEGIINNLTNRVIEIVGPMQAALAGLIPMPNLGGPGLDWNPRTPSGPAMDPSGGTVTGPRPAPAGGTVTSWLNAAIAATGVPAH